MEPEKQTDGGESEEKVERKEEEEGRKRGGRAPHQKRARGGHIKAEKREERREEKHEAAHHPRKRGGHVPGKKSASRPDRRSRGGSADANPMSSAGRMTESDYERGRSPAKDEGGSGSDKRVTGLD